MKSKLHQLISLLLLTALFVSCSKDNNAPTPEKPTLTIAPNTDIVFSATAMESFDITVTTNQPSWDAVSNQAWCIVTKEGKKFKVTALPNSSTTASAPAVITITAGTATPVKINVTQSGVGAQLTVNPSNPITFTAEAGQSETVTINVTTNQTSWDVVSNQTWCVVAKEENKFTVSAAQNTTNTPRNAIVTISAGNAGSVNIAVSQLGKAAITLVVAPEILSFTDNDDAVKTATITTNAVSWLFSKPAGTDWLTVVRNGNNLNFNVTANSGVERTAIVSITATGVESKTITITQDVKKTTATLTVLPNTPITFTAEASASELVTIDVITNQQTWNVVSNQTWCIVEKCTEGEPVFFVTANPNVSTTESRTAIITVTAGDAPPVTLSVTQAPLPAPPNIAFVARNPVTESLYKNGFFDGSRVNFDLIVYDAAGRTSILIEEVAYGAPNGNSREIRRTRVIPISGSGTYQLSQEMWNGNPMYANVYSKFTYTVSAYGKSYTKTYSGCYSSFNGAWSHYFGIY